MYTLDDFDINLIKENHKYIIFGESHTHESQAKIKSYIKKLVNRLGKDVCLAVEELTSNVKAYDNNDKEMYIKYIDYYLDNYKNNKKLAYYGFGTGWLRLGIELDIPVFGIEDDTLSDDDKFTALSTPEKHMIREDRFIHNIKKLSKFKHTIVIVGDTHLRTKTDLKYNVTKRSELQYKLFPNITIRTFKSDIEIE